MRKLISFSVLFVVVLCALTPAAAQDDLIRCAVTGENPLLRAEGRAELLGELQVTCTGGDPNVVRFLNLVLLVGANITSDLRDPATGETEALLLIDDPLPAVSNISNGVSYQGQIEGKSGVLPGPAGGPGAPDSGNVYPGFKTPGFDNRIEWNGIPVRPAGPGETRVLRVTNVRIDASSLLGFDSRPEPVEANLAVTSPNAISIGSTRVSPGLAALSLAVSAFTEEGEWGLVFTERFTTAFKKRIVTGPDGVARLQASPRTSYITESGFTPEYTGLAADGPGVADTGTRFVAEFASLPDGVFLTAPSSVESDSGSHLEVRRVIDFKADFSGGMLLGAGAPTELVPVQNGRAVVVYEVTPRPPYDGIDGARVIDRFKIPVRAVFAQPTKLGSPSVTLSYGPVDPTRIASAAAPEPRFFLEQGQDFVFPVTAHPTLSYRWLKFTPGDPAPVTEEHRLRRPVVTDTISVIAGASWLSAQLKDRTPDVLEITAEPEGLEAGLYHGAISLRLMGAESELEVIPVLFEVNSAPLIIVDTTPIDFRVSVDSAAPQRHSLHMNGRGKWLEYEVDITTASGGNWLSVNPMAGRTPVNFSVFADPTGLSVGRYDGSITIRAAIAGNSPQVVPVVLEVLPARPVFEAAGVVNTASYMAGGVSPGEMVTIFGSNVGPEQAAGAEIGPDGRLKTQVSGTRVLFDGVPGAVIAVSRTQSSVMVPYDVRGKATVIVQVEIDGSVSEPVQLQVLDTWPGIFTADASGRGQGAILNEDGTLNSPSNPAPIGSVVSFYVTGVGETQPPGVDGAINSAELPRPLANVVVRMGGVDAIVEFAGGAPEMAAGVIQINARAPATPGSAVPLHVIVGSWSSQFVNISIAE